VRLLLALLLGALLGCQDALQAPPAQDSRVTLRDQARLVLERHCGDCHIPSSPRALPAALAVYDLTHLEWASTMRGEQLEALKWRIQDGAFFDPFDVANEGKEPPPQPSEAEQSIVRRYVDAEQAARHRP